MERASPETMSSSPAVTVVIPAFNAEAYLGEALASICEQTLRDVEVIVVDDGSTDGTVAVAERFGGRIDVRVVRQANAGPAAARNNGIRLARAAYCAFLDADDVMLPDRLAAQKSLLDSDRGLGLVHTDLMTFDDSGIIHRTRRAFSDPCGGDILDRLLLGNFITTSTVMAPTARLVDAGLFNVGRRISEDFELWLRMAARWRVGFIDRPLVRYRRRSGSLSNDKLVTAHSALEVIETFWSDHPEHRRHRPRVYAASLARHLATAGSAALVQGDRSSALRYLFRAMRLEPWNQRAWKSVVKALVGRPTRRSGAGPSVGGERTAA